jgi:hypothetical protein
MVRSSLSFVFRSLAVASLVTSLVACAEDAQPEPQGSTVSKASAASSPKHGVDGGSFADASIETDSGSVDTGEDGGVYDDDAGADDSADGGAYDDGSDASAPDFEDGGASDDGDDAGAYERR